MIWVGTDGGGVSVYNPATGEFTTYKNNPSDVYSISGNVVRCIAEDKDHDVWIGTWNAGLNRYERKTGRFIHYMPDKHDSASISGRTVWNLTIDHNNHLWLAIFNAGIDLFDKEKGVINRFKSVADNPRSIGSTQISLFSEDVEHNMWICSLNGLDRYNSKTKSFRTYKFPGDVVVAFLRDTVGNLWVGTEKGLYYCRPDGTILSTYDISKGLPHNRIDAIVEDHQGNLWISTDGGISQLNRKTLGIRNFSKKDGLQGDQFVQGSFLKTHAGEIYFGGFDGFNSFQPDKLTDNDFIPQVHITELQIFNKPVSVTLPGGQFPTQISEAKEINLSWSQSVFSMEFTAINYTYPGRNQYAYLMEGFDKEWNYADASRRYVTYTNLDPGTYTFRVRASNNDGKWNAQGASVRIVVTPPFWRTLWFELIVAMFLLGAALATYRRWVRERELAEKRQINEVQAKERNLLRTLIDHLPDGIYVKDVEGRKIIANIADVKNIGLQSEAQVIGKTDFELYPKEVAENFVADDQTAIRTGHAVINREEWILDEHGEKRWLLTSKIPLMDEQQHAVGLVGIGRNITEFKKAEVERERLITELQGALADVKLLSGLVPICSNCKKIRDDKGYWTQLESYIQDRSEAKFSHGVCPDCMKLLYPEFSKRFEDGKQ